MNKIKSSCVKISFLISILFSLSPISCGGGNSESPQPPQNLKNVEVTWTANREKAVNSSGGGYRVYYSSSQNFNINDSGAAVKNVPFASGLQAPVSTVLGLSPGAWFIKVESYSSIGGTSASALSDESRIVVEDR